MGRILLDKYDKEHKANFVTGRGGAQDGLCRGSCVFKTIDLQMAVRL
jgi:hypothetical protein